MKIGLLGLGTVGSGVYEIINYKGKEFESLFGEEVVISRILVRNLNKPRNVEVERKLLTDNPYDILDDPEIDIVVEAIGGIKDAYSYISYALNSGKHVVTANKAVVAEYMKSLLALSTQNNRAFLFEASVGGGIPIIKPLKQHAQINEINEIKGILNGTSNFILTKMFDDNISFEEALRLAREKGYAEADPTDDVEGFDAARKLAILSSIAFKNEIKMENIFCRGIASISSDDIDIFKGMGAKVKLMGKAFQRNNRIYASAEPVLVGENSAFGMVEDAFNIISVTGSFSGQLQFYGQGAGKNPTANSIVCDIFDIVTGTYKKDCLWEEKLANDYSIEPVPGVYYVRIKPKDLTNYNIIMDILNSKSIIHKIIREKNDLIFISRELSIDSIDNLLESIKAFSENFSYVRMDDQKIAI